MTKSILGISAFYHDSAAALLIDGEVVAAIHEERLTRKKHDPSFPCNAIQFVLNDSGLSISDLDAVVFYDKPFLKFERLLETYHSFAPKGLKSFLSAIPVWIKEKVFIKDTIKKELEKIAGGPIRKKLPILFPEHHLSHSASAFYPSPFDEAAILTIDGVGEWATTAISKGSGNNITVLKELIFPHSIGLMYSAFTYYCGFRVNSGEYKLMGLAPYGCTSSKNVEKYKELILSHIVDVKPDGSILLNMEYFSFATGLKMVHEAKWKALFDIPKRNSESEIDQRYMDLALAIQQITEDIILKLGQTAKELTGCKKLVMAGGVALNCVANGKLLESNIFDDIWIQPAAGDAGGALGAAYAGWHIYYGRPRKENLDTFDHMQGSYLGPTYNEQDIEALYRKYKAQGQRYDNFNELCVKVAQLIDNEKVIGWFQGRLEWGPRALGNRSIIGNARNPEMQKKMNVKIKYREGFRPFAPSCLAEDAKEYFDLAARSPYMLLVAQVNENRHTREPGNYSELPLYKRLYHIRSDIPAITHIDYSARIQTVHKDTNEKYWTLINAYKNISGYGVIVNTSFNVRGEPIVCSPKDAYLCFMRTEMDFLVINNHIFAKSDQPALNEDYNWRDEFELD